MTELTLIGHELTEEQMFEMVAPLEKLADNLDAIAFTFQNPENSYWGRKAAAVKTTVSLLQDTLEAINDNRDLEAEVAEINKFMQELAEGDHIEPGLHDPFKRSADQY